MALTQLTKIDGGGISTTSDYRVGIITASKFVGPFDGTGGNFSGVVTATNGVFSGNISAVDGNFSGNVTIGGTLTYEDVTNIDSVGLITARNGIEVSTGTATTALVVNGDARVTGILTVGTSSLKLDGPNNLVNVGTALTLGHSQGVQFHTQNLHSAGFEVNQINASGIITAATFKGDGDFVELDVDGHTNLDNISIAGVTTTTGNIHLNSGAKVGFATDSNTFIGQDDYDRLDFNAGGKRLVSIVEGTNIPVLIIDKDGVNNARSNQGTNYNANPHATELVLGNTSSNNHGMTIVSPSSGYGNIQFSDGSGGGLDATRGSITFTHSDNKLTLKSKIGSVALNHKDDEKLITTDAGISILKDLDVDGHTNLDNVSIAGVTTFSTGPVVPNGTYYKGVINSGSQQKIVGGYISGSNTLRLGESMYLTMNPERLGLGINDPQRTLHLSSNNTVIALTDTAAGTNQKTKYILSDAGVFAIGKLSDDYNTATEHLYIDNNGLVIINRNGYGTADVNADNFVVKNYESSSSCGISILNADNQNSTLYFGNASDSKHAEVVWSDAANLFLIGTSNTGASIKFRVANQADALTIDSNGHLLPGSAGSQNLGSTTAEWGDVFLASDKALKLGNSQIGDLYVGSDNVTYLRNSTGQMVIRAAGDIYISDYSGNHRAGFRNDNAVDLYFDIENNATPKLSTTATGISVHGEVKATQDYPNFRPVLDFNFAAQKKLDTRITYQRTGVASFTNEFGKVVIVGDNAPRFDHDPVTRESKGLLIEPSRTNFMKYSDEFAIDNGQTGGNWDAIGGESQWTRVSDTTETKDPTGITNHASKLTHNSGNVLRGYWYSGAADGAVSKTFSVYLKKATTDATNVTIDIGDTSSTTCVLTDEWKRFSVTTSSAGNGNFIDFGATHTKAFYAWGAQIEAGSYATSYIPTSSAAVTRGADFAVLQKEDFTDAISQTEGTLIAEYDNVTSDGYVLSLDGSGGNKIGMVNNNSYQLMGTAGGSSQGTTDNGTLLSGMNRFALAYKLNDTAISINGNTATVDTSYTLPTTTFMSIGHRQYQYDHLGSCVARIMYYNTRLPNSQLKTLSTR